MKYLLPILVAVVAVSEGTAQEPVRYTISFANRVHHEAEVEIVFEGVPSGPLQIRMSRTSPGRYRLHEFARNVYSFRAFDGSGRALPVSQPDPYGGDVGGHNGTVRVSYTLFADLINGTYAAVEMSKEASGARQPLVPHFVTAPLRSPGPEDSRTDPSRSGWYPLSPAGEWQRNSNRATTRISIARPTCSTCSTARSSSASTPCESGR